MPGRKSGHLCKDVRGGELEKESAQVVCLLCCFVCCPRCSYDIFDDCTNRSDRCVFDRNKRDSTPVACDWSFGCLFYPVGLTHKAPCKKWKCQMAVLHHEVSSDPYGRCCSRQCDRSDYLSEFGCPDESPGIFYVKRACHCEEGAARRGNLLKFPDAELVHLSV